MSEWWTYRPGSFLMFSPQVYDRLFEAHNRAWWPLPLLALALGVLVLGLLLLRHPRAGKTAALLLAAGWLFVGWGYFIQRYADIHLAGTPIAIACIAQALLLLWFGGMRARTGPDGAPGGAIDARAGVLLFTLALAWPLLAPVAGRPWMQAEVIGIAPDPTALATLGLLLASRAPAWALLPVPLLWLAFSGATLASMGDARAALLAALLLLAVGVLLRRRRRA